MNKKKIPGLNGFEELFESYLTKDEFSEANKDQDANRNNEQYELQHFLEQENLRLGNIESFLTKKIPAQINFSQTEKLITHQKNRKKEILQKSVPALGKLTSQLQQNLAQLFNAHFGG
jgi:hypothetical protein